MFLPLYETDMKYLRHAVLFVIVLSICSYATGALIFPDVDAHFKWGEYDSIIRKLEPLANNGLLSIDKKENSYYFKVLGVAYAAKGRISEARTEFENAFLLDSTITVDSQYISSEIREVYYSSLEDFKKARAEKRKQDSLLQQKDMAIIATKLNLRKEKQAVSQTYYLATSSICMLACIGLGFEGYFEYKKAAASFSDFKMAASQGNLQEYTRLKSLVKNEDTYSTVYIVASAATGICGSYLFFKYEKTLNNQKKIGFYINCFPEIAFDYDY